MLTIQEEGKSALLQSSLTRACSSVRPFLTVLTQNDEGVLVRSRLLLLKPCPSRESSNAGLGSDDVYTLFGSRVEWGGVRRGCGESDNAR